MSQALSSAHARGWNLATTLMVCITVFQAGNADFGVMASAEYDGDPGATVHEFEPFQPLSGDGHARRRGDPDRIFAAAAHRLRLYSTARRGGCGRRARLTFVSETTTMIIVSIPRLIEEPGYGQDRRLRSRPLQQAFAWRRRCR